MSKVKQIYHCDICGSTSRTYKYKNTLLLCRRHRGQMEKYGKIVERTIKDRNDILIKNGYAEIVLRNRHKEEVARGIISLEDVEIVKEIKWHLRKDGYVGSNKPVNGTLLHRYILSPLDTEIVDHMDRNKLDCRRNNLRICTHLENNKNSGMRKDNSSGVRGVRIDRKNTIRPFVAEIFVNKKKITIGYFVTLEEAEIARKKAEKEYFGEFAPITNGEINDK